MNNNNPFSDEQSPFDDFDFLDYTIENNSYNYTWQSKKLYKVIGFGLLIFFSSIGLIDLIFTNKTPVTAIQTEKEIVTIYVEKEPLPLPTTTSSTSTTTIPQVLVTNPVSQIDIIENENNLNILDINHNEIIQKTVQVVVEECLAESFGNSIETFTGIGSGVIISETGHIITNAHVVQECYGDIYIATVEDVDSPTEIRYTAELLKIDPYLDLALLQIKENLNGTQLYKKFKYFELQNSSEVNLGETVFIYGFPSVRGDGTSYSLNINLSKGTVSGFQKQDQYKRAWIITDADISYGNSGGAALDDSGSLIGIPTFGSTEGASWIGYLRTMDVVIDWVSDNVNIKKTNTTSYFPTLKIVEIELNSIPKYNREDWNTWDDNDFDCQNTRHEILQLESFVNVFFTNDDACYVSSGKWFDPYNGKFYYFASDLDVDHFIPLYNAHYSGAWSWSDEKKISFANNIEDPDILIAVEKSTNREKSASGPEDWRPVNFNYWCEYAYDWIRIKYEWGLSATAKEWDALLEMINTCPTDFTFEDSINNDQTFSSEKIEKYLINKG